MIEKSSHYARIHTGVEICIRYNSPVSVYVWTEGPRRILELSVHPGGVCTFHKVYLLQHLHDVLSHFLLQEFKGLMPEILC